jgi:hypothetical protein
LASDAVDIQARLAKLEARAAKEQSAVPCDPYQTQADLAVRGNQIAAEMRDAGSLRCSACRRQLSVTLEAPEAPAQAAPAAVLPDMQSELQESLDECFNLFRELARTTNDAHAQEKYLRQSCRVAGLLSRLDREEYMFRLSAEDIANGAEKTAQLVEAHLARELLCSACNRALSVYFSQGGSEAEFLLSLRQHQSSLHAASPETD